MGNRHGDWGTGFKVVEGALVVLLLTAIITVPDFAQGSKDNAFPLSSTGDLWFQADHAGFWDQDGTPYQEFYFKINNNELKFEENNEIWEGELGIDLKFYDENGSALGEAKRGFEFSVNSRDLSVSADHSQILLLREQVDPRTAEIRIKLMDRKARKRGLIYVFSGKSKEGKTDGSFRHPESLREGLLSLSDLQLAWSITPEIKGAAFLKNGLNVVPNPARMYGLHRGDLTAYYEVYDSENVSSTIYEVEQWVAGPAGSGAEVYRDIDTVSVQGKRWVRVVRFGVQNWATGNYTLNCRVRKVLGATQAVTTTRAFNVVWGFAGWEVREADQLHEAKVYLPDEEYRRYKELSSGDREIFLLRWWNRYDPSPGTPENELYREFRRRVRIADDRFSAFGRRGIMTDRGRVFVRFGQPDEITSELFPTRVQLDDFAAGIEGQAQSMDLSSGEPVDTRPFEVWSYDQRGAPLFPDLEVSISSSGLELVFVDETGTGHWILRYQSQDIDY